MATEFRNEPLTDFSLDENRREMAQAIASVAEQLGQSYPMLIGGKEVRLQQTFDSVNPGNPAEVVGVFPSATAEHADRAVEAAAASFESWKRMPASERADVLFKAADGMRRRKFEFSAWMCFEAGKSWIEADADVAEAIDFLEFYAREAIRYDAAGKVTPVEGEANRLTYVPLGVGAVIPPWNFPCAIALGMSSAALATGNTVVLKPAEQSPTIAWKFVQLLIDSGLPAGALNFLTTGVPELAGARLVEHPSVRFISFTGSKEVGLMINAMAAQPRPGQTWIKRVVAEMGGKDAIVVDRGVDIGDAAQGIVSSAFGYSGQKCSACSRAIVHAEVYDSIVERVVELAKGLKVGPSVDLETQVGPVIDSDALEKITDYIEIGKQEGRLLLGGDRPEGPGYFVNPTVFADVPNEARLSKEEIFGPVLAMTKAKDFDEALRFANDTDYGLTGAVYSPSEENRRKAAEEYHVGNLYFNRKCTGALVGGHPFGGFNLSGTDSKAGGFDYLLLFLQAKLISEKL
ncbi:MAG: L-glutamate gamma-semialdehyde dehydrogenase [Planctomycetota bacterium]|jgi:1-pyrroline-5-carboxylate dehydrogenase